MEIIYVLDEKTVAAIEKGLFKQLERRTERVAGVLEGNINKLRAELLKKYGINVVGFDHLNGKLIEEPIEK